MFTCENCGHQIDDSQVRLPPFCPRCGDPTQANVSPFDDDEPAGESPLPPPPPMGGDLPPPPPMGEDLPPPPPSGRGAPSKTLFGMPGLSFEDDGGISLPTDDDEDEGGISLPTDDDEEVPAIGLPADDDEVEDAGAIGLPVDDDDELPFPVDDDDEELSVAPPTPAAPPAAKAPPSRPATGAKAPPIRPPSGGAKPPPIRPPAGGAKPPPIRPSSGGAKPPPLPARPGGAKPPPIPGGGKRPPTPAGRAGVPPAPGRPAPVRPPPPTGSMPAVQPPSSAPKPSSAPTPAPVVPPSASASFPAPDSGTFEGDDPFFTGDPDQMPELGSITHGDASTFADDNPAARSGIRELEFDDGGDTLELGDLDLPTTGGASPGAPVDLPAPAAAAADDLAPASGMGDLDLPAPVGASDDLDLPAPADGLGGLQAEDGLDLPAPADGMGGFATDDGLDLPAPADGIGEPGGSLELDLPAPDDGLPAPDDDFPAPADDFPVSAGLDGGLDLPEVEDLPESGDLPASADNLPTSAQDLPASADLLPTPVEDIEPELEGEGGAAARAEVRPDRVAPKGPAKPDQGKGGATRWIVYGLLGLAVVGVGGWVLATELGLLESDPEPPPPPTSTDDGGDQPPAGELAERSESVLAKFDRDTPGAYVQALEASEGDPVAQAEAALLLHHRYGPDEVRLGQAGKLLEPHASASEPYVARVVGLGLLARGEAKQALAKFSAEEPRSQLYKAWALLELGKHEQARAAAEAALETRPNDRAAQLAVLEARVAANPIDGLAALRKAAEKHSDHLALQEALMDVAASQGLLAQAAAAGEALQPTAISKAHKAELLRTRAEIARAQGRTGVAMRLLEQALASDESLLEARIDRIELWLANKEFSEVRSDLELLLQDRPKDARVLRLAADVDLEAGRHEEALERLAKLDQKDPRVQHMIGEAHALIMATDEARAAWAAARKLDPFFVDATLAELDLLLRADKQGEAEALLGDQLTALDEAGAADSPAGRAALAAVHRARARLALAQDKPELALTEVEDAIAADDSDNDARLLRARLLRQLGKREAHEEALLELHERTGGYPGLTEPLGRVLLRKGKLDELEALIGDSLDTDGASAEILLTGSALRLAQDKPAAARTLAEKVLERDPTKTRAHLMLGRALLLEGSYEEALDEIESAQTREGDAEVEVWLGQALEYNNRSGEARMRYRKALQIEPDNREAAALLGRLYAYGGAATKAIELLEPVVAETDDYPYAYLALGIARRDLGKLEDAVADLEKAQQLDPTLFEAFYQEGRIHNDRNRHAQAVKALQAGIDKAKDYAQERQLIDTWRRLGESNQELGRRADAKKAFEKYLELAPPDAAGRREVERLMKDL